MDDPASFGPWLRERRRARDLSREELARRVGCAVVTVKKIETGERRPSRQIAELILDVLAVPPEERSAIVRLARATPSPAGPVPQSPPLSPADLALEDLSGRAIRGYALHQRIGAGGFGVVYRAEQPGVGRAVAIKIILPQYANHPEFIRRFEAEAQIIARLEHPHIIPLYDYWREPGGAYLVLRYVSGGTLHTTLQRAPLPLDVSARLLDQIGAALSVAHRASVIHRDLKPSNILLDGDGNAYLADFGIAKDLGNAALASQTQPGAIIGSAAYLSPEQVKDEPVTPRSDIYSLGIMLYELLTGTQPFQAPTPAQLVQKQINEPLPPLRARRPDLPEALDAVIQRATAKNPADRYPDVLTLVADFRVAVSSPLSVVLGNRALGKEQRTTDDGQRTAVLDLPDLVNPYKGLRPFTEADAANFFGRDALVARLLERMAEESVVSSPLSVAEDHGPRTTDHGPRTNPRFLAVVGPSGSGKSSVVRAGLLPALRRGGVPGSERWFVAELVPGAHPLEELELALLRLAADRPANLAEQLARDERGLLRAARLILPPDDESELLLVIDQFEELFTLIEDETARAHFLASLVAAVTDTRSRIRVVITLRADFYDRPLLYTALGELIRARTEVILPLTADDLEQAIASPARRAGLALEPGLVAAIVKDVGEQPGALPLLQYALTELFERRDGRTLTLAAYRESGSVSGALARRADEIYAGLTEQQQEATRQLFLRLISLGEGTEDTRRRVRVSEFGIRGSGVREKPITPYSEPRIPNSMQHVLDTYGRYRLLTFDRDPLTRGPTVEVAHEALIRTWGRLREWLDTSRETLRVQRRLAATAADWIAAGRDASFLATGARLVQFEGLGYSNLALNVEELAYLDASIAAREVQRTQEEGVRQRELAQAQALAAEQQRRAEAERQRAEEQTRASKRLRRRAVWLAAAAVLALGAALFAGLQRQQATIQAANAERQASLALARQIVVQILNLAGNQLDLRLLLSAEVTRRADIREARASLFDALERTSHLSSYLRHHTDRVWSVAFSPDGKILASGSDDQTIILWDVATHRPIGLPLSGHTSPVNSVAFSPDGKLLASGSDDQTIILWDVATHQPLGLPLTGHASWVRSVAFSPDGKTLASGSHDKTIILWDVATHRPIGAPLQGHTDWVRSVAFSPDGKTLASGSNDKTIILWDVATHQPLGLPLTDYTSVVNSVAFSPDGRLLASDGNDKTIILWDVATHRPIGAPLQGHTDWVRSVVFSPDGRTLASSSKDQTVRLWDVATRQPLGSPLAGHTDVVWSVAFSPDGKTLASGAGDKTIIMWDLATDPLHGPSLTGHTAWATSVAFSPDGKRLASGSYDTTAMLWDIATRQPLGPPLRGHTYYVTSVAFSPDGKTLATSSDDKTVMLWDVASGQPLRSPLTGHTGEVAIVAFSPDGKTLASGSIDMTARLWDVATHQPLGPPLTRHTGAVYSLAFSPDGKLLATGSEDTTVILWDVVTRQPLGPPLTGHTGAVYSVAFSPDGKLLASGSETTIMFWDVATRQPLGPPLTGHTGPVFSVAFSPDGKLLASGSEDGTVILWDVATRQPLGPPLAGHTVAHGNGSVAFSPDGKTLASASDDRSVVLWDISLESWQARACQIANRNLTQAEWNQFIGADIPYQRTCPDLPAGADATPAAPTR
jgi:WD40 repeat protein/serine/threonine protein kinase/DNA-binding XRE family transcriptional regulator